MNQQKKETENKTNQDFLVKIARIKTTRKNHFTSENKQQAFAIPKINHRCKKLYSILCIGKNKNIEMMQIRQ
jgi:hypothetical protein